MEGEYCKILEAENAALSERILQLERDAQLAQRRADTAQRERNSGLQKVQLLRDEVDEIMGKEESATLRAEHLYRDLSQQAAQMIEVQRELAQALARAEAAEASVEDLRDTVAESEARNEEVQRGLVQALARAEAAEASVEDLRDKVAESVARNDEVHEMQKQLVAANNFSATLKEELAQASSTMDDQQQRLEEFAQQLNAEREKSLRATEEDKSEIEGLRMANGSLHARIKDISGLKEQYASEREQIVSRNEQLRSELASVQQEMVNLSSREDEVKELRGKIDDQDRELQALSEEHMNAINALTKSEKNITLTSKELIRNRELLAKESQRWEARMSDMQLENTMLKAKIESKERALRMREAEATGLRKELDRCIESKRLLMATSNDFDMQLHAIMSELRSKAALLKDSQKSNAALVRERNAAQKEVHALRARVRSHEALVEELLHISQKQAARVARLARDAETFRTDCGNFRAKLLDIDEHRLSMGRAQSSLRESQNSFLTLTKKLGKAEAAHAKLSKEHVELKEMVGPQTETLEKILQELQQSLNREEQMSAELRMTRAALGEEQ